VNHFGQLPVQSSLVESTRPLQTSHRHSREGGNLRSPARAHCPNTHEQDVANAHQIPLFARQGHLVYFSASKKYIGFYPPIRDETLKREATIYASKKGNLQFLLDQAIPYALIGKIVKARVDENMEIVAVRKKNK